MKVLHYEEVPAAPVSMEGAEGCQMRTLIGPDDRAPSFSMRQFEVAVGGHTCWHRHAYEHEVFILAGEGILVEEERQNPLRAGSFAFVPPNQMHQFRNTGSEPLKFLCLVPHPLRGMSGTCVAACGCS